MNHRFLTLVLSALLLAPGCVDNTHHDERLVNPPSRSDTQAIESKPAASAANVVGGLFHTCALTRGGDVRCWGDNKSGQLGNQTFQASSLPVTVSALSGVIQIEAGSSHTCALTSAGAVKCWGLNTWGQLGNESYADSSVPVQVVGLTAGIKQIALGSGFSCAVKASDGSVVCWGLNNGGQIGNNAFDPSSGPAVPTAVVYSNLSPLTGVDSIAAGGNSACVIKSGGVLCWGANDYAQLGLGTATGPQHCDDANGVKFCAKTARATTLTQKVTALSANQYSYCALINDGSVKCWGDNRDAQLANGATLDVCTQEGHQSISCSLTIRAAQQSQGVALTGMTSLMTGMANSYYCGLAGDKVICWGGVNYAEMGAGQAVVYPTTMSLVASGIKRLSAGLYHICGITPDDNIECWGRNSEGERGVGDANVYTAPTTVFGF